MQTAPSLAPPIQEMTAAEFAATYPPGYYAGTWADVPDSEAFITGGDACWDMDDLYDSIATHGITDPVNIEDGEVTGGHHRVVIALALGSTVRFRVWGL